MAFVVKDTMNNAFYRIENKKPPYLVSDVTKAHQFTDKHRATAMIHSRGFGKNANYAALVVVDLNNCQESDLSNTGDEIFTDVLTDKEVAEVCYNILDAMSSIQHDCLRVNAAFDSASHNLSIQDRKIGDILHKIELDALDEHEMTALCTQIKEIRRERRIIKNQLELLKMVKQMEVPSMTSKFMAWFAGLSTKTYTPRELPELFKKEEE